MKVLDRIYNNHQGLDEVYRGIFNALPGLENHLEQLELCDRNGNINLALWLVNSDYVLNKVVPCILEAFSDILTHEQLNSHIRFL